MDQNVAVQLARDVLDLGGGEQAMERVFTQFLNNCNAPPLSVMQFFERFRDACDSQQRKSHGVYFTPPELASYITRCAAALAQQLPSADSVWVDPSCGSGVFLHTVAAQLQKQNQAPASLLGFELLSATASVARQLAPSHARVLQTNPLIAPEEELRPLLVSGGPLVVLGNPPYSSRSDFRDHPQVQQMMAPYRQGLSQRKVNLSDDFVHFIRWGQCWIERAGCGVMAFVTSSTYLDGLSHRSMRESLLSTFDKIFILDLGGSVLRQQTSKPQHGVARDENLFKIRSGIAVGLFLKQETAANKAQAVVHHASETGTRAAKLKYLSSLTLDSTPWRPVQPTPDAYTFRPQPKPSSAYDNWLPLHEIFAQFISGIQTKNDALLVAHTREELEQRLKPRFEDFDPQHIHTYICAPFDVRYVYYDRQRIGRPRWRVARHLMPGAGAVLFMRQNRGEAEYNHILATPHLPSDRAFYSAHGATYVAPLMLHEEDGVKPNMSQGLHATLATLPATSQLAQEPLLMWRRFVCWMYAVLHCRQFRQRFHEQLSGEFPRIPLPEDKPQFDAVANLGAGLWRLHIATQQVCSADHPHQPLPETLEALRTQFSQQTLEYRIGGYAVLRRWFKQRASRSISPEMVAQAHAIAETLEATRQIQQQISAYTSPFVS